MKKFIFGLILFATVWVFGYASVTALSQLVSQDPDPSPLLRTYFFPRDILLDEPRIRAEIRASLDAVAIGEEFEIVLVATYVSDEVSVISSSLKDVSLDPFEIRSVRIEGAPVSSSSILDVVVAIYTVQCVTCLPGEEYNLPYIPLEVDIGNGPRVTLQVSPQGKKIPTVFIYNPELTDLRGMKPAEAISVPRTASAILIGGGVIMGLVGIVVGVATLAFKVFTGRRKVSDPATEEFRSAIRILKERFGQIEDMNPREFLQEVYLALGVFVFKKHGVDLMTGTALLIGGQLSSHVEKVIRVCEEAYSPELPTREAIGRVWTLLETIIDIEEGGAG